MSRIKGFSSVLMYLTVMLISFSCAKEDLSQDSNENKLSNNTADVDALSETTSTTTPKYRINAGGTQLSTSIGTFAADSYRTSATSSTWALNNTDILNTSDDDLYRTVRYGTSFGYAFPVSNGSYTVKLHFLETYFTSVGKRKFDVKLENNRVLDNYDFVAKAGFKTAIVETFNINVADGTLNIDLSSLPAEGGIDNAQISAIEILSTTTSTTTSPTPTTSTANMLFRSGFESGITQQGASSGNSETYLNLTGTDNATGYAWPIRAWSGNSYIQAMAYNGYKSYLDGSRAHSGSRSLYQEVTPGHTADGGTYNQLSTQWLPANPVSEQKDLYFSAWYYLQPDLASKLVSGTMPNGLWGNWRVLWEMKTGGTGSNWGGDLRHKVSIIKNGSGGLNWELNVDNNANGGYPCSNACFSSPIRNTSVAVPLGQWFRFETFLHRSTGSDGRWWVKVNGQTLIDRSGPNMGSRNLPMNRVFLSMVYTNGLAPQYQWVDDVEIYNAVPAGR